jgi:hypothetical protein
LKTDSAASVYRGVIFEADAIDRQLCGGNFQLRKCTNDPSTAQEVTLTLQNTSQRYTMADLHSLDISEALNRIIVPDASKFESTDAFHVSAAPRFPADDASEDNDPEGNDSEDNTTDHYETLQFQMTVGKSHPTKLKGAMDVVQKAKNDLPAHSKVTCAFGYVVPDDGQESYLKPQYVLKVDGKVRVNRDSVFSDRNQYRLVIEY